MNTQSQLNDVLKFLKDNENPLNKEGMKRFAVGNETALGISLPMLRNFAKRYPKNHSLALELWNTGIHEAQILATIIDDPKQVTEKQMQQWVQDFYSWDICDQCCGNLFGKTQFKWKKANEWILDDREFVKRAGFVMMVCITVKDKKVADTELFPFFDPIVQYSSDPRNFVRKAVNWALRQLGKRSSILNIKAIEVAEILMQSENKTAQWIGKDAYRELTNPFISMRLKR